MLRRTALVVVMLLASGPVVLADEPRGSFGFTVEVDGAGFILNPTVKSVTISAVAPGAPAALAGIAPKDQIVEADGHAIVGAKAKELEPVLRKKVGESVKLRLKRPNGEAYDVVLVAVARAAKP